MFIKALSFSLRDNQLLVYSCPFDLRSAKASSVFLSFWVDPAGPWNGEYKLKQGVALLIWIENSLLVPTTRRHTASCLTGSWTTFVCEYWHVRDNRTCRASQVHWAALSWITATNQGQPHNAKIKSVWKWCNVYQSFGSDVFRYIQQKGTILKDNIFRYQEMIYCSTKVHSSVFLAVGWYSLFSRHPTGNVAFKYHSPEDLQMLHIYCNFMMNTSKTPCWFRSVAHCSFECISPVSQYLSFTVEPYGSLKNGGSVLCSLSSSYIQADSESFLALCSITALKLLKCCFWLGEAHYQIVYLKDEEQSTKIAWSKPLIYWNFWDLHFCIQGRLHWSWHHYQCIKKQDRVNQS